MISPISSVEKSASQKSDQYNFDSNEASTLKFINSEIRTDEKKSPSSLKVIKKYHRLHDESTLRVIYLHEENKLISCSKDMTIIIRELGRNGKFLRRLVGHKNYIFCLTLLKNKKLASASSDTTIKIWNIYTGKCEMTLLGHQGWIFALIEIKQSILLSGSWDRTIRKWDLQNMNSSYDMKIISNYAIQKKCSCLTVLNDTQLIASSGEDIIIYSYDPNTIEDLEVIYILRAGATNSISLLQDGVLATITDNYLLKLWDVNFPLESDPLKLILRPDLTSNLRADPVLLLDRYLLTFTTDIQVWDLQNITNEKFLLTKYKTNQNIWKAIKIKNDTIIIVGEDQKFIFLQLI